jgi:UDP-N-acetylmuramate--alanine ligase
MLKGVKKVHFVGIGGAGMSGIAHILLKLGYSVSGSDIVENVETRKLAESGAKIYIGHRKENPGGVDLVVFSSAVSFENPELKFARENCILCIPRSQMLAEMMKEKIGVAITGTHGKTTTTSLVSLILKSAGFDPTILVGGELNDIGGNACLGDGEYLVAEADESDGSFLMLSPQFAIVTNIEDDHLDYYGDIHCLMDAFTRFSDTVFSDGGIVLFSDHPNNLKILKAREEKWQRAVVYGFDKSCEVRGDNAVTEFGKSSFSVIFKGKDLGRIEFSLPGVYNIYNGLAACSLALTLGIKFDVVRDVLSHYCGTERRFQIKGEANSVLVIEDYAHHPTEIRLTLEACRKSGRRIVAIFQPHRYTRTAMLAESFSRAFDNADVLMMTDIYPAGEAPIKNVSSEIIVRAVREAGHPYVRYIPDMRNIVGEIKKIVKAGDIVIILGAGNINELSQPIIESLESNG